MKKSLFYVTCMSLFLSFIPLKGFSQSCEGVLNALSHPNIKQSMTDKALMSPLGKILRSASNGYNQRLSRRFVILKTGLTKRVLLDRQTGIRFFPVGDKIVVSLVHSNKNIYLQKTYDSPFLSTLNGLNKTQTDIVAKERLVEFIDHTVSKDFFASLHEKLNADVLEKSLNLGKNLFLIPGQKSNGSLAYFNIEGIFPYTARRFVMRNVVDGGVLYSYLSFGPHYMDTMVWQTPLYELIDATGGFSKLTKVNEIVNWIDLVDSHGRNPSPLLAEKHQVLVNSMRHQSLLHKIFLNKDDLFPLEILPNERVIILNGEYKGQMGVVKRKPSNNRIAVTVKDMILLLPLQSVVPLLKPEIPISLNPITGLPIDFKAGDHVVQITTQQEFIIKRIHAEYGFNPSHGYYKTVIIAPVGFGEEIIIDTSQLRPKSYQIVP
ncbi:MAG: hypothetical protein KDD50_09630 [Bdellovibrionales bacterium]|nr:hypothetical protein [Bdellovibrionales bacterium]